MSSRNYLITSTSRNMALARLAETRGDSGLFAVREKLEFVRLNFLCALIGNVLRDIETLDGLRRIQWVTFLHSYLLPDDDDAPSWDNKVRQIIACGQQVEAERSAVAAKLEPEFARESASLARLFFPVQEVITRYRDHGREIMDLQVERIRAFTLSDILHEVERHLADGTRLIDFTAVFGLSASDADAGAPASGSSLLDRDPVRFVAPLASNGATLLDRGEFVLAERIYRSALQCCGPLEAPTNTATVAPLLRGMTRSLQRQGKLAQAMASAERERGVRGEARDPELDAIIGELAAGLAMRSQGSDTV